MLGRALLALSGLLMLAGSLPAADDEAAKELQGAIDKYIAAYNEGALDKVMDFWAENADFVDIRGNFHAGRDLISALFRRGFANNPGRKIKLTSDARKFLSPEIAMDDGILELTSADGEVSRGRYTVVLTKVGGQWVIRSARDIPLEQEEEPAAAQSPPLEELGWLVGKWEAKSEKYQIALDCDWQLEKKFLVQKYHVKSSDDDFVVVTWITFDPSEERFRSWYFDSRGGFGGGPWSLRDDTWRSAVVAVLPDGKLGSSYMTWQKVDDNTAIWRAINREVGGESVPDSEQKYVRVKGEAATAKP